MLEQNRPGPEQLNEPLYRRVARIISQILFNPDYIAGHHGRFYRGRFCSDAFSRTGVRYPIEDRLKK